MATNSDGIWNGSETNISFVVDPAFWQTWWFRLSCVLVIGLATLTFFRLRMLNLTRQMNIRMEERVNERTRIARELHDSLLQGFQGLMFRLQAVQDLLPNRPIDAMRALENALSRGDDVIAEGRGTVEDLRSSKVVNQDLVQALSALREELTPEESSSNSTTFRVLVEGKPRGLDPVFRDETYRIAREALRNAFHHSHAQKIEAEMTYGDSQFVLRIRDDGNGIDPKYLDQGKRAGHWGLPGMRERAKRLGGQLEVWSEHRAGTEVELTVPASIAYETSSVRRGFWFWRKLKGGQGNEHQS
jgi:signal transduction histidine kinase